MLGPDIVQGKLLIYSIELQIVFMLSIAVVQRKTTNLLENPPKIAKGPHVRQKQLLIS
jgi:hypothetical protein